MTNELLSTLSTALADIAEQAAPAVVQVHGRRRPATGVVYADGLVLTMASALGHDDALIVRRSDGEKLPARLAGWDPASGLALLAVDKLGVRALATASALPRVGSVVIALARSWSNALTASAGIVSVIGGPLATGRRRAIEQVIRVTAPMHDGFAGGALLDASGALAGITTAAKIRGLPVVIPSSIAWATAATLRDHGTPQRPYLGIAAQRVRLADAQRGSGDGGEALLVIGVTSGSPAASAGVLVGDVLLACNSQPVASPDELLELLGSTRAGDRVTLRLQRGGQPQDVPVTVGERKD